MRPPPGQSVEVFHVPGGDSPLFTHLVAAQALKKSCCPQREVVSGASAQKRAGQWTTGLSVLVLGLVEPWSSGALPGVDERRTGRETT